MSEIERFFDEQNRPGGISQRKLHTMMIGKEDGLYADYEYLPCRILALAASAAGYAAIYGAGHTR
ncbi:MAG: hypothetical protein J5722_07325 [Oscillospiraceae bacterium]|nr:hypothetical protein [Oscillospiraceae bacterium]